MRLLGLYEVDRIWETARTGTTGRSDVLGLRHAAEATVDMVRATCGEVLENGWKVRV